MVEKIAGAYNINDVLNIYKRNMKPREKTVEEKKDEEIEVKPPLPSYCGNNLDMYV